MSDIIKTGGGDIDVSSSPIYAAQFGDGSTYGLQIEINGDMYRYVPKNVIQNGGLVSGNNVYILPWLLNSDNLKTFSENATTADLSNTDFASWLNKNNVDTNGYMYKESAIPLDSSVAPLTKSGLKGDLNGLKVIDGNVVVGLTGGAGNRYWNSAGEVHDPSIKYTSLLGDWTGGLADDLGISSALFSVAQPINEFFNTDVGKAIKGAALVASLGGSYMANAAAEEAAAEAAKKAAEDAAAQAAADAAVEEAAKQAAYDAAIKAAEEEASKAAIDYSAANYGSTVAESFLTPEQIAQYANIAAPVTADAITNEIAATQPTPTVTPEVDPYDIYGSGASQWGSNGEYIDLGAASGTDLGGWSPATGATEAELAQARAAMAASPSLTFKQALDGVRAGLFVNAIAGDPLGLGGGTPSVGGGTTGFDIVPVPTEWKSPTYAPSAAPIDLESIFSNQNMLGGTQWQNLPSQRNLTFNDVFAAGQQQTPMGTPVDINQIVGSILGQTATR